MIWSWLLGPVGRWFGVGALVALLVGGWWVAHTVSQWQEAYRNRPVLEAAVAAAEARSEALVESARKVGAVLESAETQTAEASRAAGRIRLEYREAVREDPTCAAWAATPIACPLGGLSGGASGSRGDLPGDSGQPDP